MDYFVQYMISVHICGYRLIVIVFGHTVARSNN